MLPSQINDLVKWEEDGEPRIWSPLTEKWSSIKKYSVKVEAQIGLTEKTPELERLERLEYILYAMACYAKNIIDEKNKYISNLNEKNKILKKDFYEAHENLEVVDQQYKQSLLHFEQVEQDNNNYILELDNELEELYAKIEEYENKILDLNEKLKKHELEKNADTESYISRWSNTLSGLIEVKDNNSKNTSNSNAMQTDSPIGLGLQYSKDEENGKEIDLPHKTNKSNFSEYDAEYSSDNVSKNESFSSYKQRNSSFMPKKTSVGESKKGYKNILEKVEVLSNPLHITSMENSRKEDYSEDHKCNHSSSSNQAAIRIQKDINTNFDSAYDSSSSRQFTVPENTIETRMKSNLYSAIKKKNSTPILSFSKKPPILPPCKSVSSIEKKEEPSNSYSSIIKSEIGSRRGSWTDLERSIDSIVSESVDSKSFSLIESNALAPASSMPKIDSEEDKSVVEPVYIVASRKPSYNDLKEKIEELTANNLTIFAEKRDLQDKVKQLSQNITISKFFLNLNKKSLINEKKKEEVEKLLKLTKEIEEEIAKNEAQNAELTRNIDRANGVNRDIKEIKKNMEEMKKDIEEIRKIFYSILPKN